MIRVWIMLCVLGAANAALATDSVVPTEPWPPSMESLRDGDACAAPPPCDIAASVDERSALFSDSDRFVRILSTTASDCSSVVAVTDPRAGMGSVVTEPLGIALRGNCVMNKRGEVIGAVHNGILASCQATAQPLGAVALETAIIDLAESGEGKAEVPVFGLPWILVGQRSCELALDVRIEERAAVAVDAAAE